MVGDKTAKAALDDACSEIDKTLSSK
jgi:hypothetical protein